MDMERLIGALVKSMLGELLTFVFPGTQCTSLPKIPVRFRTSEYSLSRWEMPKPA
jgi:hypothetical protein